MKALVGGTVLPVSHPPIKDGVVLFDEHSGKILTVGKRSKVKIPEDTEVIDVSGKYISPGFVDAHSHIGMIPDGLEWEFQEANDFYSPIAPHLRAIDGFDPYDEAFNDAIAGGVTTVATGPGSANVMGGVGLIAKTYGDGFEKVINPEAFLKMALGPKRPREYKSKLPYPTTRMGTVAFMRIWFKRAQDFMEGKIKEENIDTEEKEMLNLLAKALKREIQVKIHLSTSPDEIYAVLRIIKEFNLNATIDHAFGSQLVVDMLSKENVPVIYGPPMIARIASFFRYVSDEAPVLLFKKGVNVSIMTDHPVLPEKHLRLLAAAVARNGLSLDEALKLITINPAKALGIDKFVGSLEPGKDADIVVSSGHPINPTSRIEIVFGKGKEVFRNE
ncbi:amidohydrolase [Thermococcus sp. M39]|uniref:amidohydrolase n=1 Tax=unclassified Thermococcus TaxID=2627626 RepID=UPI0014398933|nr:MULTISPECIES: amidohydrolase [unclassified Thermococcus]NJE08136.1 amidohydrolase [Thermococcus sp. M39]NJE11629.1 amidohydrolase [Thermococcus sp. LS2]